MSERRVVYVVSEALAKISGLLPSNRGRSTLVHSLASALGSSKEDQRLLSNNAENAVENGNQADFFGLEDDCPTFPRLPQYAKSIAGATLGAVNILKSDQADVCIVWDGGRDIHHAGKSRASGYCYINDINLGIISLRRSSPRPRVMYIDLDLHFGDGVVEAFLGSSTQNPSVLTLSIHHSSPGFFPASPNSELTPLETATPFALSIPLYQGASNVTFSRIWKNYFVVLQCGVDGLAGDPYAIWNWGIDVRDEGSMGWCINRSLSWGPKILLLGGGGYHSPNAARSWSYLTSIACGSPLSLDLSIPDHSAFPMYAPSFILDVPPGNMTDQNKDAYLRQIEERFAGLVDRLLPLCTSS
ncbi:hypothetical protein BS47DRAFT_1371945 [Hydnum rufescens UP504]|uniref:histone deacetylase n=1 Tax=Hydnum rufescens UP504 TaxID=1448309 RepID=A0A9P6B1B9_9AGAM|nr:hypothetical protein BS47DRAFT_1371945 [Hydnum rufescens UP504]